MGLKVVSSIVIYYIKPQGREICNKFVVVLFIQFNPSVEMAEGTSSRFRDPKTQEEDAELLASATPKSTQYKTKWAVEIFRSWQMSRARKFPELEVGNLFKDYPLSSVEVADEELKEMSAISMNYWLSKFVQEVANKNGGRYPSRTVYQIVCGIKRHLEEQNGGEALNPFDNSDKRYLYILLDLINF